MIPPLNETSASVLRDHYRLTQVRSRRLVRVFVGVWSKPVPVAVPA